MATIDLRKPRQVNFATVELDFQKIIEKLFENQDILKMLYYNTADCTTKPDITDETILMDISKNNIRIIPNLEIPENKGSIIIITFNNFLPNDTNPKFMNNVIIIDILCPTDVWMMDNYMMRPFRIMHEINSMFDKQKLNGIGTMQFITADIMTLGNYSGYQMAYSVINDV